MSIKESTAKKNYSNIHPKNKNIRVAKGPEDYEEDPRSVMEIMRDEFGTTWEHQFEDEFMKPEAKKKKPKKKKKKRA
jgi:hypothetical protein